MNHLNPQRIYPWFSQLPPLAYLHGQPELAGQLRAKLDHFIVVENMSVLPSGEGEHWWLKVQKKGMNTSGVVRLIANFLNVPAHAISYSGLKDKQAITSQWLGVHAPKIKHINVSSFNAKHSSVEILECVKHHKKLRVGTHESNSFEIVISQIEKSGWIGDFSQAIQILEQRLEKIKTFGVPNYFGEQRFGHDLANLTLADEYLFGKKRLIRHQQSLAISAARSAVFNHLLSQSLSSGEFSQLSVGAKAMLDGSNSFFEVQDEPDSRVRWTRGDIHLALPLIGEDTQLKEFSDLSQALAKKRVKQGFRSSRVIPQDFSWQMTPETAQLKLSFTLPKGAFATSVARECVAYTLDY